MDFVSVRELRTRSAAVWDALSKEKGMVATSNGKPIAILSATSASTLEASLATLRPAGDLKAICAPKRIRTSDLPLRRRTLYPAELSGHRLCAAG